MIRNVFDILLIFSQDICAKCCISIAILVNIVRKPVMCSFDLVVDDTH